VPLVEQELLTLPEHLRSPPVFSGVRVAWSFVFCVVFSRSMFVLISFFFCPLCCLSFSDLRILINLIGIFKLFFQMMLYTRYAVFNRCYNGHAIVQVCISLSDMIKWVCCPLKTFLTNICTMIIWSRDVENRHQQVTTCFFLWNNK